MEPVQEELALVKEVTMMEEIKFVINVTILVLNVLEKDSLFVRSVHLTQEMPHLIETRLQLPLEDNALANLVMEIMVPKIVLYATILV